MKEIDKYINKVCKGFDGNENEIKEMKNHLFDTCKWIEKWEEIRQKGYTNRDGTFWRQKEIARVYLDSSEEKELEQEIEHLNPVEEAKIVELTTSYHRKGREEVARNMLKMKFDIETIAKATGISTADIEKLKNEVEKWRGAVS